MCVKADEDGEKQQMVVVRTVRNVGSSFESTKDTLDASVLSLTLQRAH